jgi:hypothetical protein
MTYCIAPWMFSAIWSVIKTGISAHTKSKIHLLGADYHGTLEEYISTDNFPMDLRRLEDQKPVGADEHDGVHDYDGDDVDSGGGGGGGGGGGESAKQQQITPPLIPPVQQQQQQQPAAAAASVPISLMQGYKDKVNEIVNSSNKSFVTLHVSTAEYSQTILGRYDRCEISIKSIRDESSSSSSSSPSTGSNSHVFFVNEQMSLFPLHDPQTFALVIDTHKQVIQNGLVSFRFDLTFTHSSSSSSKTLPGQKTEPVEPLKLHSKLQVLMHENVPVDDLLCWVNFYDKNKITNNNIASTASNQNSPNTTTDTVCMLKVVLSYKPIKLLDSHQAAASSAANQSNEHQTNNPGFSFFAESFSSSNQAQHHVKQGEGHVTKKKDDISEQVSPLSPPGSSPSSLTSTTKEVTFSEMLTSLFLMVRSLFKYNLFFSFYFRREKQKSHKLSFLFLSCLCTILANLFSFLNKKKNAQFYLFLVIYYIPISYIE